MLAAVSCGRKSANLEKFHDVSACIRRKDLPGAARLLLDMIAQSPGSILENAALGEVLLAMRQFGTARTYLAIAARQEPDNVKILNNLGLSYLLDSSPHEALPFLERAQELRPGSSQILMNLARCYNAIGASDKALELCQVVTRKSPANKAVRHYLAHLYGVTGQFDRAIENHQWLIEHSYRVPDNLRAIVLLQKQTPDNNQLDRILSQLQKARSRAHKNALHFAAGKTLIDLERYEEGLGHIVSAKLIRGEKYNRQQAIKKLRHSIELFTPQFFEARAGWGDPSRTPIFIIGMPRSGSTLTEQILDCHPAIAGVGERNLFQPVLASMGHELRGDEFARNILALDQNQVRRHARDYLDTVRRECANKPFIVNKFLHNFLHIPLISLLFPNAVFIYCKRDPMDCCTSIFTNPLDWGHKYSIHLADLGWYYRYHEKVVEHWRSVVRNTFIEVNYEDTVNDLEGTIRRVLSGIGLEWDDACLAFSQSTRTIHTCSKWQVRQPLYSTSVGRWKRFGHGLAPLERALEAHRVAL